MANVVDFHTHILPGIDDGSKTSEESVAMLQMEAQQGIEHVVLTPHFSCVGTGKWNLLYQSKHKESCIEAVARKQNTSAGL